MAVNNGKSEKTSRWRSPFREFRSIAGLPRAGAGRACVYWVKIFLVLPSSGCSRLPLGCAGRAIPARLRISERFRPTCRGSRPAQPVGTTGRRPYKPALPWDTSANPDGTTERWTSASWTWGLGMSGPMVRPARPAGRRRSWPPDAFSRKWQPRTDRPTRPRHPKACRNARRRNPLPAAALHRPPQGPAGAGRLSARL